MGTESDRLNKIIERDSRRISQDMLEDLLGIARRWRPGDYEQQQNKRRAYYEGRATSYITKVLRTQFPKTFMQMSALPVNVTRHMAEQMAAVYSEPPERFVFVGDAGEPDQARTDELNDVCAAAQLGSVMQEAERRTVLPKTGFLRVGVDTGAMMLGQGRLAVQHYWPQDTYIVPHPAAPANSLTALAFVVRIAGPNGHEADVQWFEVWTRPCSGLELGPLSVEKVSTKGESTTAFGSEDTAYPLPRLPFVRLSDGEPEGSPYMVAPDDDLCVADAVHQTWTDQLYQTKMQTHSERVYKGTQQKADFIGGPGQVWQVGEEEDISILSYPDNRGKLDTLDALTKLYATLNRISPDSFQTDGNPTVNSGIDRVIANIPQTEARRERVAYYKSAEENELLPVMAEVADHWLGTHIGHPQARFEVKHSEPSDYEDPEAAQRRIIEAKDAGLITEARAAVDLGYYKDIAEATEKGLSDELKGSSSSAPAAPMFSLRERLNQVANAAEPEAEDDDGQDDEAAA